MSAPSRNCHRWADETATKDTKRKASNMSTTQQPALLESVREKLGKEVVGYHSYVGDDTILIRPESVLPVMKILKEQFQLGMLADLSAVDYLDQEPRFEVVYHLNSL